MNAREMRAVQPGKYVLEETGFETRAGLTRSTLNGNEQSGHHSQDCKQ